MIEVDRMKVEEEVWGIINRGRKRRRNVNEEISMEDWTKHFMELAKGMERRVVGRKRKRRVERQEEGRLRWEEVQREVKKMKEGKASGGDGIPGEVWKYGGMGMRRAI